jgi:hypothetical protein
MGFNLQRELSASDDRPRPAQGRVRCCGADPPRLLQRWIRRLTAPSGVKIAAIFVEKVSDAQLATVNMFPHDFHGEWNYTIAPNRKSKKSD